MIDTGAPIPTALSIAGSDSGGGAGIQADLKTFLALGIHGMSAITALTAQNTLGVSAVQAVPPEFVAEQIKQVATDIGIGAAKTGMLSNPEIVGTVAAAMVEFQIDKLVVDPVFVSKNNDKLLSEDSIEALINKLFPLALVITPNLYEAGALTGTEVTTQEGMKAAARTLWESGARNVLIKGGHLPGDAVDILFDGTDFQTFSGRRIETKNTHGTGCTLSAAITAYLARGLDVPTSVGRAKEYVTGAIEHSLNIGKGYGPTNHGWNLSK